MPQGENYSCFHWGPFKCVSNEYCTYYPTRLRPGLDLSSVSKDLRLTRTSSLSLSLDLNLKLPLILDLDLNLNLTFMLRLKLILTVYLFIPNQISRATFQVYIPGQAKLN